MRQILAQGRGKVEKRARKHGRPGTLGPPKHDDELYPECGLNGLPARVNGEEARGLTETYVLKIEDDVFTARIVNGSLDVSIAEGDPAAIDRCFRMLRIAPRATAAA